MKSAILLILSFLFLVSSTIANDFDINSFHVDITIHEDGSFLVSEKISVFFNEKRRGIYRSIPTTYLINGNRYKIKISDIKVASEKAKITGKNGKKVIRIGNPNKFIEGNKTYFLTYRVDKALVQHQDDFEFYWNLTGNEWEVPIEKASFSITYPEQVELSKEDLRILADDYDAEFTAVEYSLSNNALTGTSTKILKPREGITIATMIPSEYFSIAPVSLGQIEVPKTVVPKVYPSDLYFPVPALLLGWFLWLWRTKDRHQEPVAIVDQYYAPEDMSPTEVGAFYDYQVNNRDLLALIPKWGNEGLIQLESVSDDNERFDIYFHKKGDIAVSTPDYEQDLFNGLFANDSIIFLEDLKNKFYKIFSSSKSKFSNDIFLNHLYDPSSKRTMHNPWSMVFWIAAILAGGFLIGYFHLWISGGLLVLLGLLGTIITYSRPKMSDRGFRIHNHLRGLNAFLSDPDPGQLQSLLAGDSRYLDNIFPYVVAFGLDEKWNKKLETIEGVSHEPSWYRESHNSSNNSKSRNSFTEAFSPRIIESAFTSAPASSGSNSGGGGVSGRSGGGFGGGGGGSW